MIKTINKNFLILTIVFIGVSAIRICLNENQYINNIVAFINIASLLFVCFLILDESEKHLRKQLGACEYLGEKIKNKKKVFFKKCCNIICILLSILGVVYSLFIANSIINDIIGFLSLFLSIETEYIANCIGEIFFKIK